MLPKPYSAIFCCCNAHLTFRKNTYFASLIQQGRTSTNYEQAITQGNGNSGVFLLPVHLAGRKELVLASLKGKVQGARVHFPATTLQFPAIWPTGAQELSGSGSRAGAFWPESVLRTRVFHLRTRWFDRPNGKGPKVSYLRYYCLSYSLSHEICMHENATKMRPFSNFCYAVIFTVFSSVLFL